MLITLARKPLGGQTVVQSCLGLGTGAINVASCRVGTNAGWSYPRGAGGTGFHDSLGRTPYNQRIEPCAAQGGRWPANILLTQGTVGTLDAQSGVTQSGVSKERKVSPVKGQFVQNATTLPGVNQHADRGGASRYFYKVGNKP